MRRAALALGAVLAFVAAHADATVVPAFSTVPTGKLSSPETVPRPKNVPGKEKVPGFKAAIGQPGAESRAVVVLAEEWAKQKRVDSLLPTPPTVGDMIGCYGQEASAALHQPAGFGFDMDESEEPTAPPAKAPRPKEWEGRLGWAATVWHDRLVGGVALVHRERVLENAGGAVLEFTDAWFDPRTNGFRLVGTSTLPLEAIATAPGGLRIFAGRDERTDKRLLQFVVLRPKSTPTNIASAVAMRADGTITSQQVCAHARTSISITEQGDTGILELDTILPEGHPGENTELAHLPAVPKGKEVADVRTRRLRIQLSVSKTSHDKEPVVAVSTGWAAPTHEIQRLFPPQPFSPPPSPGSRLASDFM